MEEIRALGPGVHVCPFCEKDWEAQGRPSTWRPNRSLSISATDTGLVYLCHRASCGKSGAVTDLLTPYQGKKWKPKPYLYRTRAPEPPFVVGGTAMTRQEIIRNGVLLAIDRGTVAYTMLGPYGEVRGVVDRSYTGREPKSITYNFVEPPYLAYPWTASDEYDTVVLVEDIVSAIRGSRVLQHVSLNGTHLSKAGEAELWKLGVRQILVALDNDATDKAIKLAGRLRRFNAKVLPLDKDIKDMTMKEFDEYEERLWKTL